jgi:sugar lactone lactonase YvrE
LRPMSPPPRNSAVSRVPNISTVLGEGPVWDERTSSLYLVDIDSAELLRLRENGVESFRVSPGRISAVFLTETARLLCATDQGLVSLDTQSQECEWIGDIERDRIGNRTNDGKCDSLGRLWIGTMDASESRYSGALYRMDQGACATRMLDGIGVSNGLDWSPDAKVLYYTDSMRRLIWRFPFDQQSGALGPKEVFVSVPEDHGCPDGLAVDSQGFIWSAHWDGWRITRYDPQGAIDRVLWLPVPRVTSLCFGGADYRTLFITSARIGLSIEVLNNAPLSGALFTYDPGVAGRPSYRADLDRLRRQA